MPVETQVIWNWPVDQATGDAIKAEAVALADKETQPPQQTEGPGVNQMTVSRWWVDLATAETWVAFVEQYNPVSATIIN